MNPRRKAISPVIATVIIVAVAIAISIAVAGWLFGLWGSLTGASPKVSVYGVSANVSNSKLNVIVHVTNEGAASDKIVSAIVTLPDGTPLTATDINPKIIPANSDTDVVITVSLGSHTINQGDIVNVKIVFSKSGPHVTSVQVTKVQSS